MKIKVAHGEPPFEVLAALDRKSSLYYTTANYFYFGVWTWETFCGVFGDGPNASYEWFIWDDKKKSLETSDCGYGSPHVALRDVLNKIEPPEA